MRLVSLFPAVAALFLSGAACAQSWDTFTNQENFFSANFPGTPTVTQVTYKTSKGTQLPARAFTVVVPPGSRLSGTYSITVVDYANAKDEIRMAVEYAADAVRAKGKVKYDAIENLDLHATQRLTVETANDRILAEILFAENNRLYISQAETSLKVPPPAQFQASLQVLDDKGARIRTRTLLGLPEGSKQPIARRPIPRSRVVSGFDAVRPAGQQTQHFVHWRSRDGMARRDPRSMSGKPRLRITSSAV